MPFVVVGYFDSTQVTAGTWAANPTNVVVNPKVRPGQTVGRAAATTSAVVTLSSGSVIPYDNTKPQNTEGTQILAAPAYTPTSASNILKISGEYSFNGASGQVNVGTALFQDSTADALYSNRSHVGSTSQPTSVAVSHEMLAATASATTFKMRGGPATAVNVYVNGNSSGTQVDNGTSLAKLTVEEISV